MPKINIDIKFIQQIFKKHGIKMPAIEIRELKKTMGMAPDEKKILAYIKQLRGGR